MSANTSRRSLRLSAAASLFAVIRSSLNSAQLGSLAILASTTTGEAADPTKMPAAASAARITLLRTRSARHV
jgi:hypothetical protein